MTKSHLILSTPFKVRLPRESAERPGLRCHRSNAIRTWWREALEGGRRRRRWETAVGVSHMAGRRVVSWGLKTHGSFPHIPANSATCTVSQPETPPGDDPGSSWRLLKSPLPSHLHSPQWRFLVHLLPTGRFQECKQDHGLFGDRDTELVMESTAWG